MPSASSPWAPATALAFLLGAFSPAAAQQPAAYGCDRPIHLAYAEFGLLYHAGIGIDPDLIEELGQRTGCRFETEVKPRDQTYQGLEAGTVDMTNSGIRTEARREFAYFIPYLGWKNAVVTTPGIAAIAKSFDAIVTHADWRIGVVRGYVNGPYYDFRLRIAAAEGRVISYPDQEAVYGALKRGEVQAIVSSALNYDFFMASPADRGTFVLEAFDSAPVLQYNMIFSVKRFTVAQIDAWCRLFEQMRLDGTLARIYRKWLSAEDTEDILQ
jgi:polar amino acid transport system substrate-binding protein